MYKQLMLILSLEACLLQGCANKPVDFKETETTKDIYIEETLESEAFENIQEETAEINKTDYHTYIPVYLNGESKNLYDLLETDCILYFAKTSCDDCSEYKDRILEHLEAHSIPYHMITVSEHAEETSNCSIDSKVAKGLGLSKVPVLCFMKDGAFLTNTLDDFENNGELIDIYIRTLYENQEGEQDA